MNHRVSYTTSGWPLQSIRPRGPSRGTTIGDRVRGFAVGLVPWSTRRGHVLTRMRVAALSSDPRLDRHGGGG